MPPAAAVAGLDLQVPAFVARRDRASGDRPDGGLGGAVAQELIFSLIMMKERFVAPSINIDRLDPLAYGVNIIREAREAVIKMAMSNSFGFGWTNGSIAVAKV